jgi:hypothetical protein
LLFTENVKVKKHTCGIISTSVFLIEFIFIEVLTGAYVEEEQLTNAKSLVA